MIYRNFETIPGLQLVGKGGGGGEMGSLGQLFFPRDQTKRQSDYKALINAISAPPINKRNYNIYYWSFALLNQHCPPPPAQNILAMTLYIEFNRTLGIRVLIN